jgi:hypothetical protein
MYENGVFPESYHIKMHTLYTHICTTVGEKPAEKPALQALGEQILSGSTPVVPAKENPVAVSFSGSKK